MSGATATAAYRIIGREFVTFLNEEDGTEDVVTRRTRSSWSPRVIRSPYDAIKPDLSNPMEAKSTRQTKGSARRYPHSLAKIFFVGFAIFLIGCTLFVSSMALSNHSFELTAWVLLAIGASVSAVALMRAQDLSRRQR